MTDRSKITPIDFAAQSKRRGLHVAIIMDGNGRWAVCRGLPRVAGHRAGARAAQHIVDCASSLGLACLTLYAFSSDNWRRPAYEVHRIFWLLRAYLRVQTEQLRQRDARLEIIGRRDRLPESVVREIAHAEAATSQGRGFHLRVAVDYSSRDAIARAAACAANTAAKPSSTDWIARSMSRTLTAESGEVDLLIRTGGEKRLSDFLLWESAYAELHFTDRMWPDFDGEDLSAALTDFHRRDRRFGAVPEPAAAMIPAYEPGGVR